jgi:hypothetical protein
MSGAGWRGLSLLEKLYQTRIVELVSWIGGYPIIVNCIVAVVAHGNQSDD